VSGAPEAPGVRVAGAASDEEVAAALLAVLAVRARAAGAEPSPDATRPAWVPSTWASPGSWACGPGR
jgi:hypothetical protein